MPLNLITDPWIPVRREDSGRDSVIRPDQIAEPDVLFPDWPRPDLNLACLELLIGLVYLACPPKDTKDWKSRQPDADALRKALAPLALAFNLLGDGPRFLQDFESIEGESKTPGILFMDSAGQSKETLKKNVDLMVKRDRYLALEQKLAAMALYTLQAFASGGGPGHRTSMRGGGPMVTLVRPQDKGLWSLIWANVPQGESLMPNELEKLPWMRPTATSEEGTNPTTPPEGELPHPEVFFGQPRRLRLISDVHGQITEVIQKKHGTNYEGWKHPLTPYRYDNKKQRCPMHPKDGEFGYRNWLGIVIQNKGAERSSCLEEFIDKYEDEDCRLLVGGWAMKDGKATAVNFLWSEVPIFKLNSKGEELASRLVDAAEQSASALVVAVCGTKGKNAKKGRKNQDEKSCGTVIREMFFHRTQVPFELQLRMISDGDHSGVTKAWLSTMRTTTISIFDAQFKPGLADMSGTQRQKVFKARRQLFSTFKGFGMFGEALYVALDIRQTESTSTSQLEIEP